MLFYGGHPRSILCETRPMETQNGQQLPAGFIKLTGIPHDIHVPHMVTVPWINNASVSDFPFRHKAPSLFLAITAVAPPEVTKHPQRKAKIRMRNSCKGRGRFAASALQKLSHTPQWHSTALGNVAVRFLNGYYLPYAGTQERDAK